MTEENLILGAGIAFGYWLHWLVTLCWRRMYVRGKAECWRCHGSGKEGR